MREKVLMEKQFFYMQKAKRDGTEETLMVLYMTLMGK